MGETRADADMANVLTMDEARPIASNIAKLPNYLAANPESANDWDAVVRMQQVGTIPLLQLAGGYSSDSPLVARRSGRSLKVLLASFALVVAHYARTVLQYRLL